MRISDNKDVELKNSLRKSDSLDITRKQAHKNNLFEVSDNPTTLTRAMYGFNQVFIFVHHFEIRIVGSFL